MLNRAIVLLLFLAGRVYGQSGEATASRLWSAHIQPLFAENCFKCHGNIEMKSGLILMSQADVLKGGDSGTPGPALVSTALLRLNAATRPQ